MSRGDFIPNRDLDLTVWADNFHRLVQIHRQPLGMSVDQLKALTQEVSGFHNAMKALSEMPRASTLVVAKNKARRSMVTLIRQTVNRFIRFNPYVDDVLRHEMGLNFPKNLPPTQVPVPSDVPEVLAEPLGNRTVRFPFRRQGAARWGRPRGVAQLEIAYIVLPQDAPPPSHVDEYVHCLLVTRSPAELVFDIGQSGMRLWFICRWINTTAQPGRWSDPQSVTIS